MMIEKRKAPAFHCPRWEELPDMDLYMDQVVTLLNEYLKPFHAKDQEKMVTSTMINNRFPARQKEIYEEPRCLSDGGLYLKDGVSHG